jgi:hypothetical protein
MCRSRQVEGIETGAADRLIGQNHPAFTHHRSPQRGKRRGDRPAGQALAVADVAMEQDGAATKAGKRLQSRVAEFAEKDLLRRRDAIGLGFDDAIEDEDIPLGKALAQMIEGAAHAKAEFEDDASRTGDFSSRECNRLPLGDKARNHRVEPAHCSKSLA